MDPDLPEYQEFWREEEKKVLEGVNIDGYQFSGWLYWHINHWCINLETQLPNGEEITVPSQPLLRDNELIINEALLKAEDFWNPNPLERKRKGLAILGLRQMGKTTFEASYIGRSGVIFKGSQNLILGTNLGDLNNITQNIDFGLLNCSPWFRTPRITRDWDSERVQLGYKDSKGDNQVWSQFVIRNTAGGKKTEAGAGTTVKSMVYDEIGKDDFIQAFAAVKPAMLGRFGYRAIPILVGTGGSFEKGDNAKELFFQPSAHNMVEFTQPDGRVTGLFMPGWLRQDCKYETTLGQWLLDTGRLTEIPRNSELFNTKMLASNREKAEAEIMEKRNLAQLSSDPKSYLKEVMYYPLTVDEVFLTADNNIFAPIIKSLEQHKYNLTHNYQPRYVDLYRDLDGKKVVWKTSEKKPITEFPVKAITIKDAPVVMYEEPLSNLPYATYICGIDPYNQDVSETPSLGSCYIFKRSYDPFGNFQNSIVCSYTGRPGSLLEFYGICEMMIELYNAIALPENEGSIVQYFVQKNKDHLLFNSPELTRYINPDSATQYRQKGLAATTPNQKHYMNLMYEYAIEEIEELIDGKQSTKLGLVRIPDPMLITEMINYRSKTKGNQRGVHGGNYDRICAFGHCLTLATYLDRDYPIKGYRQPEEEVKRGPKFISPFDITRIDHDNPKTISPFERIKRIF